MIISDEHKYLFVELPFTASTAISRELREFYTGRSILGKHSTYREFLRLAKPEQKRYFVFSGVRNPLDEAVSLYVKYRTNPSETYTSPEWWVTRRMIRRFRWVQAREASFADYLKRFYWLPYENWASLDHHRFQYVYRLETVVTDFTKILMELGISPVRKLPLVHRTRGKADWQLSYTPDTYGRATRIFGPFMEEWGYTFPTGWPELAIPQHARLLYRSMRIVKNRVRLLRGRRHRYPAARLP